MDAEVAARKSAAWGAFHKYRKALCNHDISLKLRLKLFNMCISPVALFGMGVSVLTRKILEDFAVVQRRILRSIIGWSFNSNDSYKDTMHNMKLKMQRAMQLYFVEPWGQRMLKQQINYALHLSSMESSHPARLLLDWNPTLIKDASYVQMPFRSPGRSRYKWIHFLSMFSRDTMNMGIGDWINHIQGLPHSKRTLQKEYAQYVLA